MCAFAIVYKKVFFMGIENVIEKFGISAREYVSLERGHINLTFLVTSQTGEQYVLQMINPQVFNSPEAVMLNISEIGSAFEHEAKLKVPNFLRCDGKNYAEYNGDIWRMYVYTPVVESVEKCYRAGFSHGRFINVMSRNGVNLETVLPFFHNYERYVEKLRAVCHDKAVTERFSDMGKRLAEVFEGVPKRNIHGDAKADNIIIGEPCTVIDLDTAMHGYAAIDYGDMIRSADMSDIERLTQGFAEGLDGLLTEREVSTLYYGVLWVTAELAARYYTDVYSDIRYFVGKSREQCHERAESLISQLDRFEGMKREFAEMTGRYF